MTDQNFIYRQNIGGNPVKAWVKGVSVEHEAWQQVDNIASMPFIHKHVAIMPDCHWGMGATIGSVIATKGAVIPASVGVDLGCFRGDTKVPLLDGRQYTLAELSERKAPFWVYSVDRDLRIVPGRSRALKTRERAEVMRVVVSGGDEVICTPDHRFMLIDGSYKEAAHLRFNDSLMPLYRRWQTRDGYESVNNGKGRSAQTHVLVYEYFNGKVPSGHVVQHKNHDHFDNSPDNFDLLTSSDHSAHHRRTGRKFANADPKFQELRKGGIAKRVANPAARARMSEIGIANIQRYMAERPGHFKDSVAGNGAHGAAYLREFNITPRTCDLCGENAKNPAALHWHKVREHQCNHKVISTERLDEICDVYCLQVETHNNFALAAGVFVHNCGMMAQRTSLVASDLPDNLFALRTEIERRIPHGRTNNGGVGDRGAWRDVPDHISNRLDSLGGAARPTWRDDLEHIFLKHPGLKKEWSFERAARHLGTLGTGNHFVEICLDEEQRVWVMLHSGSRGIGNRIGTYFIERAKREMEKWFIQLPDADLAYLPEGSGLFDDYIKAVEWAQDYARLNRELMMSAALAAIEATVPKPFTCDCQAVNCHHNYVSRENHFGANVLVTRKGAVRAREGDLGIIPGSMGAKSFIVRGKGNPDSFHSCSHGAGRAMSRGEAKRRFTLADHEAATSGVECRKDADVLDETPAAYKSIDAVMAAQTDLVDVVHTLRQVVCVKG